jgi:hypothetical protein
MEGTKKFIYALKFSMTVTDLIFTILTLSQQLFTNNYYVRLHENPTDNVVAVVRSNTDE